MEGNKFNNSLLKLFYMNNLFINETMVNETEGYQFGESGWYETFTDNIKTLFRSLQKEYGKATKMYRDTKEGSKQVGWVFHKTAKYDDSKEHYQQNTWVEVSTIEPVKQCKTTLKHPFK